MTETAKQTYKIEETYKIDEANKIIFDLAKVRYGAPTNKGVFQIMANVEGKIASFSWGFYKGTAEGYRARMNSISTLMSILGTRLKETDPQSKAHIQKILEGYNSLSGNKPGDIISRYGYARLRAVNPDAKLGTPITPDKSKKIKEEALKIKAELAERKQGKNIDEWTTEVNGGELIIK